MNRTGSALFGFFLGLCIAVPAPAQADDTEIYFGGTTSVSVRPNILFVLDTSGSMGWEVGNTNTTRLENMQEALTTILSTIEDVNVGLMRFGGESGGQLLLPVTYVDGELSSSTSVVTGEVSKRISSSANDAEQRADGSVVLLQETGLIVLKRDEFFSNLDPIDVQITDDDNDVEQSDKGWGSNNMYGDWSRLYLDEETDMVGLRFEDLSELPQGAIITEAYLEMRYDQGSNNNLSLDIWGNDVDDASAFQWSDSYLTGLDRTDQSVEWTITRSGGNDTWLKSPDLSDIVQELVDRPGWASDNIIFLLDPDNANNNGRWKRFYSRDSSSSYAPRLHIEANEFVEAVENDAVGLRFEGMNIPQGATITSAHVELTAAADSSAGGNVQFRVENSADSVAFESTNNNLSARTFIGSVTQAVPELAKGEVFSSPDLSDQIQTLVNRNDWCGGNAITVLVDEFGSIKPKALFYSAETATDSTLRPQLVVNYDPDTVPADSCQLASVSIPVVSSQDDVEENSRGSNYYASSELNLNTGADSGDPIGLRFQGVGISQGTEVSSAHIQLKAESSSSGSDIPATIRIYIENSDDADDFGTERNGPDRPSQRTTLSNYVDWEIDSHWTQGDVYQSPDLSALVNEVVARDGWESGNSLAFILVVLDGDLEVESFDSGTSLPPTLVLTGKEEHLSYSGNTVRAEMISTVEDLSASGNTPIVDALYESALYYRGEQLYYGDNNSTIAVDSSYTGSGNSKTYISPITETCQASYIVLLTDGEATRNNSKNLVKAMTGNDTCSDPGNSNRQCGYNLTSFLAENDQISGLAADQLVKTFTIGFNFSSDWLKNLGEEYGGGGFYEADDSASLTEAFDAIIKSIKSVDSTFVEAGITANQFNSLTHLDEIYYGLFKPQESAKWDGNLKKYRLTTEGGVTALRDQDGELALDPLTGFFSVNARSYWSLEEDGNTTEAGGAASMLPAPASRKIYTFLGEYPVTEDNANLSDYPVTSSNSNITRALLDTESKNSSYRSAVLNWARGNDDSGNARYEMGDPLHSNPVIVTYAADDDDLTHESVIFIATNEGYLHAVDTDTGVEKFAFIPRELLGNLQYYYEGENMSPRPYGLDGPITAYTVDGNDDGDLLDSEDTVTLIVGMRRGGNNYYALDVRDINNPKLKWVIRGPDADENYAGDSGFEKLGQTWSQPKVVTLRVQEGSESVRKDYLLFGGGYDATQDDVSTRTADDIGNAIFIVDPDTGELVWSAGDGDSFDLDLPDMDYSIPSEISIIDIDSDGVDDQLYVGDMGGQVWRFDIASGVNVNSSPEDLMTGAVLARLSSAGSEADARRFYYPPDVSLNYDGSTRVLAVAIGSGWRAHPLNEVIEDRFYLLKQYSGIFGAPTDDNGDIDYPEPITEATLYDVTDNLVAEGTEDEQEDAEYSLSPNSDKRGWMLRLERDGEKVLSGSLTFNGSIIFTTYEPEPPDAVSCQPQVGTARAYIVEVLDGQPSFELDGVSGLTSSDRELQLSQSGIPSTPTVVDTEDGKPQVLIGVENLGDEVDLDMPETARTYWLEGVEE